VYIRRCSPFSAHEELISLAIGRIGARAPLPHHNCGNTIKRFVAYLIFAKTFEKPSDVYPRGFVRVVALSPRLYYHWAPTSASGHAAKLKDLKIEYYFY
jgi:hypothetical protein